MTSILFICTSNIKRSPTAEELFSGVGDIETKSAGIYATQPQVKLTQELIDWADIAFVMSEEEKQFSYTQENFILGDTKLYNLNISDTYHKNEHGLKLELIKKVAQYLDLKPHLDALLQKITFRSGAH